MPKLLTLETLSRKYTKILILKMIKQSEEENHDKNDDAIKNANH